MEKQILVVGANIRYVIYESNFIFMFVKDKFDLVTHALSEALDRAVRSKT